ncbi:juvenile hormone acid O-methyltransferase-like [Onthophagus taurus]|uniref:juvenile hormone acid O-methyltransferase-like n=1 Tax=Onthophagus taurus TaxID=166361 RepID=UPI0039BEB946
MFDAKLYEKFQLPFYVTAREILSDYGHLIKWPKKQTSTQVMKILDAGCGEGTSTVKIFQEFVTKNVENYQIVGVDFSEEMISTAKEKYHCEKNCEFEQMDLSLDTFPDKYIEHFDLIYSMYCLNFVATTNWIKNFYEMLKPSGQIFFATTVTDWFMGKFLMVNQREEFQKYQNTTNWNTPFFTKANIDEWLKSLLKNAGFKNITIQHNETTVKFLNKDFFSAFIRSFTTSHSNLPTNLVDVYINEVVEEFVNQSTKLYGSSSEIIARIPRILVFAEK